MGRKTYSNTLDQDKYEQFKIKCEESNIAYNEMLETLIDLVLTGQVVVSKTVKVNLKK